MGELPKFNHLSRYSQYDVATEERKIDRFLGGLNPQLRCALSVFDFPDFQTLVNKAFIAEREHKLMSDNKSAHNDHKCKFEPKKEMQPAQKVHTWQPTPMAYQPSWQQNVNKATTQVKNDVLNPVLENRLRNNSCYSCGQTGHYAKQCPKNNRTNATFKPQIHYLEAGPSQHDVTGYVHHIFADEAQENPEVVIGMFPVNNIPAVILFDSGASHSFISRSFVAQNKFPCSLLGKNMLVQTPGSIIQSNLV